MAQDASTPEPAQSGSTSDEVKLHTGGAPHRTRATRRRHTMLGSGILAVLIVGLIGLGAYYAAAVLSYAEVDPADIRIRRDARDPDQLAVYYRPMTRGAVSFRVYQDGRLDERFDRVAPMAVGNRKKFEWRIDKLRTGDPLEITYLSGWKLYTRQFEVPEPAATTGTTTPTPIEPPQPPVPADATLLSGQIINSADRRPIRGALVRIPGTRYSARTDEDGYFHIAGAPPGKHWIEVLAEGYNPVRFDRELVEGKRSAIRIGLNPGTLNPRTGAAVAIPPGQVRFVLEWDGGSQDLDGHLEGPLPGDGRFHVDYRHPADAASSRYVELAAGEGAAAETITVGEALPGVYRYFVHDFTNRSDPQSTALAQSGARVKVYVDDQMYRFSVEEGQEGNLWDVCTVEIDADGRVVNKIDNYLGIEPEVLGLYDRRTQTGRQVWITNYGGNADSEDAVREGLTWLGRHQDPQGFWSNTCLGDNAGSQCKEGAACTGPGGQFETAQTGLTLLALQAGGHYYFNNRKYSPAVRKGLDWLVSTQHADGALVSNKPAAGHPRYHNFYMYDHGIAAFALADACAAAKALGHTVDSRYLQACEKAVRFIENQQHSDGGWRYSNDSARPGDTSVSGWQVLALKSAKEAGIDVNYQCIEKTRDFFDHCLVEDESGRTWYQHDGPVKVQQTEATTGMGMLVRQFLLGEADHPMIARAASYLAGLAESNDAAGHVDDRSQEYFLAWNYYTWYNCTLAMFQAGGDAWQRWNDVVRNTIIKLQRHDGCERGSWDPDTQWGDRGGRIYTTALAILTLETYYRYTQSKEVDEQYELVVVSPGEIPQAVVRAKPEPIEFITQGPGLIEELPVSELPPLVEMPPTAIAVGPPIGGPFDVETPPPVIEPPTVPAEPPPIVEPPPAVVPPPVQPPVQPPLAVPSRTVGGSKIITVGAARYGDLQIEAEVEEMDDDTFKLTLRTSRGGAEGLAPLLPSDFRFQLVAADGRSFAVQEAPPERPVAEGGRQIFKGSLHYRLGPRSGATIHDLAKLTLSYKNNELEHSLRSR